MEIITNFGECTCCLRNLFVKSMWQRYEWNGTTETYAEMLFECFGLNEWYTTDQENDQICDDCIKRLRDACCFKKQVLEKQQDLIARISDVKIEESNDDMSENMIKLEHEQNIEPLASDVKLEDIEFLYDDVSICDTSVIEMLPRKRRPRTSRNSEQATETRSETDVGKPKWPRKLPTKDRYKTYKQYTAEDMRDCIRAIRNGEMTLRDASAFYNVPHKTVAAKIRAGHVEDSTLLPSTRTREFISDVRKVLRYTNVTPFKSSHNQFLCAYCTDRQTYEPDELREHTVTQHTDRVKKVECMLRPYYENEMLKIDITDLKCTICNHNFDFWLDMIRHLESEHNQTLTLAKTFLIPFKLSTLKTIKCAICDQTLSTYKILDQHMNSHFSNYFCSECGESFVTIIRLKSHERIHDVGKYRCDICNRRFPIKAYLSNHIQTKHGFAATVFKCQYCPKSLKNDHARRKHVLNCHKDKMEVITCELCGELFYLSSLFEKHMKRKHNKVESSLNNSF